MSKENKMITGRFLKEVINEGNLETINELVSKDYIYHGPNGVQMQGPEALKEMLGELRSAFADLMVKPNKVIAENNIISVQFSLMGTHEQTQKQIEIQGMVMSRIENGLIQEDWEMYDTALMMQQLGVVA